MIRLGRGQRRASGARPPLTWAMLTSFQSHRVACLARVGRPSLFEGISGCGEG